MSHRSEEGIALIAVLWALTLLSLIAAALIAETRSSTHVAHNMADKAAARAAADAGIERVILDLKSLNTDKTFHADGTVYAWRFADGIVRISLRDETGKVNLNKAPEELLAALFASAGVDPGTAESLADAVADFRDKDGFVRPHGAEAADYRAAGLAWGPKNAPFHTVAELQQVLGMTAEIFDLVAPNLTTYTLGATLNPSLASGRLTAALRQAGLEQGLNYRGFGIAYLIRAEATTVNGGVFVREAVVQLPDSPVQTIVDWRQGARQN
jgi:general secretion pathway protein K